MVNQRYEVTITHGESGSVYAVVDTLQPEAEQPAIVESWNIRYESNARFLATDFCRRHNENHERHRPQVAICGELQ